MLGRARLGQAVAGGLEQRAECLDGRPQVLVIVVAQRGEGALALVEGVEQACQGGEAPRRVLVDDRGRQLAEDPGQCLRLLFGERHPQEVLDIGGCGAGLEDVHQGEQDGVEVPGVDRTHHGRRDETVLLVLRCQPAQPSAGANVVPLAERVCQLKMHLGVVVVETLSKRIGQLWRLGEERLAQSDRVPPHARMSVGQGTPQDVWPQRRQSVQRAQRVQPCQWPLAVGRHFLQQRHGGLVLLPVQHLLRHVALPAAGTVERRDQAGRVEAVQPWDGARLRTDRVDAVDAALVMAGAEVDALLPVFRDPLGVLDHGPVHVGDPQGAVRSGLDHRRPKPVVARRQELGLLLVSGAAAGERRAARAHDFAVNQEAGVSAPGVGNSSSR